MSEKIKSNDRQYDRLTFHEKDKKTGAHEHEFYIPSTGVTGYHGENASKEDKVTLGNQVKDSSMYDVNPGKKK